MLLRKKKRMYNDYSLSTEEYKKNIKNRIHSISVMINSVNSLHSAHISYNTLMRVRRLQTVLKTKF